MSLFDRGAPIAAYTLLIALAIWYGQAALPAYVLMLIFYCRRRE